jgi:amino acid transporter
MPDKSEVTMKPTLGLTGLTMNAMALIAPGAFLWLTFVAQGTAGATAPSMWPCIFFALMLCFATAVCYAEMAKLYPGTGSSYYFASGRFSATRQLGPTRAFRSSSSAGARTCTIGSIPA